MQPEQFTYFLDGYLLGKNKLNKKQINEVATRVSAAINELEGCYSAILPKSPTRGLVLYSGSTGTYYGPCCSG